MSTTVSHETLSSLSSLLPGRVVLPDDPAYAEARLGWNLAVDQRPAAVVTPAGVADVVRVVRFAAAHGLAASAQPRGHGATRALDGTILLRTGALAELSVDERAGVLRVGAGVQWGPVLEALSPLGLGAPAGSNPDPTVAGYSLGGGLGLFARAHGLAANRIRAVELVDASGEAQRVTAESDPELFWALRGCGGDFGVVTALELDLFALPALSGGSMMWPVSAAPEVLRAFRALTRDAPDELSAWAQLMHMPELPDVPEPLRGGRFVSLVVVFAGPADEARAHLGALDGLPEPLVREFSDLPLSAVTALAGEPTDPMPVVGHGLTLRDLSDGTLDALVALGAPGSPFLTVQVRQLGGALARGADGLGAAGRLDEPYGLFLGALALDPETAARAAEGIESLERELAGARGGRVPYTFLEGDEPVDRAFAPEDVARLRRLKEDRDPAGVIRSNHPLR